MALDRPKRPLREPPELSAAVERFLRSLVSRAAAGDLNALSELQRLCAVTPVYFRLAIAGAHHGPAAYSYGEIGRELGMTRQGAQSLAERT